MGTRTLLTLAEFERLPDDGLRHEINAGELISMTWPKSGHTLTARIIDRALSRFAETRDLGLVLLEAGYLLSSDPPTLRAPDVSFLRAGRVCHIDPDRYIEGAPDLAVEVVSPGESAQDLAEKVRQYLAAGAHAVWVVYPKTREVHVFRRSSASVLTQNDVLEAPELLPGFSVPVSELFA